MVRWLITTLLFALIASACSSPEEGSSSGELPDFIRDSNPVITHNLPDEPEPFTITPDLIYNEGEELLMGDDQGPAAVDGSGRLLIADNQQSMVHIFETDGEYKGALGREGSGPGEFSHITDLAISGDTLHILDAVTSRVALYNTRTMEHIRDLSVALAESETQPGWMIRKQREGLNYRPIRFFIKENGNYLIVSADGGVGMQDNMEHRTYEFSLFDTETESYDRHDILSFPWTGRLLTHWEKGAAVVLFDVPFIRETEFGFDGEKIVAGWTEDLALNVYDGSGSLQHALHYPFEKTSMRWRDAESWLRKILAQRDAGERVYRELLADTPEHWPAFHSLILDDRGRAWIAVFGEDREHFEWYVVDIATGEVENGITLPRYKEIFAIQNGFVYTREQVDEMESYSYQRYRYE
ncbi:MAG: 6-bladed beta-propeller [Balneolaceae bacterium]|nr:6-bladed beta-propeller [Balneolaceae bacterium]MCH8548274.1 6-bladed beta-propeller [Balneolaceae bacterium]